MLATLAGIDGAELICTTNGGQRRFGTAPTCKVCTDSTDAGTLLDLRPGDELEIDGQPAVKIKVLKRKR